MKKDRFSTGKYDTFALCKLEVARAESANLSREVNAPKSVLKGSLAIDGQPFDEVPCCLAKAPWVCPLAPNSSSIESIWSADRLGLSAVV